MVQLSATRFTLVAGPESRMARDHLYKRDYPRGIDRHIDFFGDGGPRVAPELDGAGEILLESLA